MNGVGWSQTAHYGRGKVRFLSPNLLYPSAMECAKMSYAESLGDSTILSHVVPVFFIIISIGDHILLLRSHIN